MKRAWIVVVCVAACVAACGSKGGGGAPADPGDPELARPDTRGDLKKTMLDRLAVAAKCGEPGSQHRLWCAAARDWDSGVPGELSDGPHVFLGLSIGLLEDGDDRDALADNVLLTAFAVNKQGDAARAVITDVGAQGGEEKKMVDDATAAVTQVLSGHAKVAQVAAPLHAWLVGIPPDAPHSLTREEKGWRLKGQAGAEIRKVGDVWVALELPVEGPPGLFVSIFTDEIEPAP